jgi:thiol-disulfide isomerase/thioredoxin
MKPQMPQNDQLYRIAAVSLLLLIAAVTVLTAGCTGGPDEVVNSLTSEVSYTGSNVEKVELFHFYSESRCESCEILGNLTEETVNTYYTEELQSGRLVFAHINSDMPENSEIIERYGPTGSSLWIGIYDENGFYKEELLVPWYMLGNKPRFMGYIRAVIDPQLA